MPTPVCPKCQRTIPPEDINVGRDVAYCRQCNVANLLSELADASLVRADLNSPPPGTWYRHAGAVEVVGASHRAVGQGVAALFACLFWNGILSIFVGLAVSATLYNMHIPVPDWLFAPKMNGSAMGWGVTLGLWAFLVPFILIGITFIWAVFMAFGGRTEVWVENGRGRSFVGVGSIGWSRRFDVATVEGVEETRGRFRNNPEQARLSITLKLRDGKKIKFGSGLSDERREFMIGALHQILR